MTRADFKLRIHYLLHSFLLLACCPYLTIAQDSGFDGAVEPATDSAIYGQGVRETAWQTPVDEQAGFHLPPGFSIELFASEPQIAKPLNMAWDARGRLWVTSTVEYPYPASGNTDSESLQAVTLPRDTIRILEDTNGDGRADQSTLFADGLNIPIGLLPMPDGVICFSIPNLWYLKDTDGDDRVDERIKLLGPFDTTRDTHGMINALRRGDDGWIYACHGFNNQSQVTARDGSSVHLISGNTFRFRDDGSRVEQFTHGQVNPFGMTFDQWGNWYSADCHSKPLTALLAGGCYPSFGRPHDGLGFAPAMMDHLHGSTAICGLAFYQAEHFPAAYRARFYSGNVMTSRINCNALEWQGATAKARELPDLLTSDDPWFRPVDLQVGPDGALYVADFYNKIIGHYEVPLDHPGRDRDSGRIWRIVYSGQQPHRAQAAMAVAVSDLTRELENKNVVRRKLAIETALASPAWSDEQLVVMLRDEHRSEDLRLSCLEILFRRGKLTYDSVHLTPACPHQRLLATWIRLSAELPNVKRAAWLPEVRTHFPYVHPQVNRSACRLLAAAGSAEDIPRLTTYIEDSADDPAAVHVARMAIRDILRDEQQLQLATVDWIAGSATSAAERSVAQVLNSSSARILAQILPAVDSELSAARLLAYVAGTEQSVDGPLVLSAITAATQHASAGLLEPLLATVTRLTADDLPARAAQFAQICNAYLLRHEELDATLVGYGRDLQQSLASELSRELNASGMTLQWTSEGGDGWQRESRNCRDGSPAELRSSLTRGEQYTGRMTSEPFACPAELRFWLAGHNGRPDTSDLRKNAAHLRHATTQQVLATAEPPRNDVAREVVWDLSRFEGQPVRVEVVDNDAGGAYAWIAIGRFSDNRLNRGPNERLFDSYLSELRRGLTSDTFDQLSTLSLLSPLQRARAVAAALEGQGAETAAMLVQQAVKLNRNDLIPEDLGLSETQQELLPLATALAASATAWQQAEFAKLMLQTVDGCDLLRRLLESGSIGLHTLKGVDTLLPAALPADTRNFLEQQIQAADKVETASAADRLATLDWTAADATAGQQLFRQHCVACHQLRGEGSLVGPQLDGAIVRGVQRLGEDILTPNVNVDKAFRVSAILLDDERVLNGLVREESDGSLVITGQDGKSQQVGADRVLQRRDSANSLMPSNFGELLNDQQLVSLLQFMNSQAFKRE